jgi:heme/copper-type cytochrome/quinol oxidase subunit 2
MNYTNAMLFFLGILGILLHNLVELNKINRASDGNVKILKYLKLEMFTIIISIIVVIVAIIVKQEIEQLESVGKWLGLAFVAVGYMAQSLLIFTMGKATTVIGDKEIDDKK